jgi:mannose-6-phosphate isomerase-like protein (cupin superfamily)
MTDPDVSHRIHIAANDPAFAEKREAAVQVICTAISAVAVPMGYVQKGTTWARETAAGKTAINLQRSRYGFDAVINLRFLTPEGDLPETAIWQEGDDIRIDRFYMPAEGHGPGIGAVPYMDVHHDPNCLDLPMNILRTRALPWLDAHHQGQPAIADFVPRPVGGPEPAAINLAQKLSLFSEHWSPRIIGAFNGHDLMVVKVQGTFNWHAHPETDDFFMVLHGQLTIRLRDGDVVLNAGEVYVVPKGVEHCPMAADEAHILLIEPKGTPNTGDVATAAIKTPV